MAVVTRAYGNGPSPKREIADRNPNRKSLSVYNISAAGYVLIYLEDQTYPVVNLPPGGLFTMNEVDDRYYGKLLAYDSAAAGTIYVTEISS